eukprot:COSAG04_NODE_96_length_26486_cov_136.642817_6_plen_199_part_00
MGDEGAAGSSRRGRCGPRCAAGPTMHSDRLCLLVLPFALHLGPDSISHQPGRSCRTPRARALQPGAAPPRERAHPALRPPRPPRRAAAPPASARAARTHAFIPAALRSCVEEAARPEEPPSVRPERGSPVVAGVAHLLDRRRARHPGRQVRRAARLAPRHRLGGQRARLPLSAPGRVGRGGASAAERHVRGCGSARSA